MTPLIAISPRMGPTSTIDSIAITLSNSGSVSILLPYRRITRRIAMLVTPSMSSQYRRDGLCRFRISAFDQVPVNVQRHARLRRELIEIASFNGLDEQIVQKILCDSGLDL